MTTLTEQQARNWPQSTSTSPPLYGDDITNALIARCLAGEDTAYVSLYEQYASMIYRLTFSLLQNKEDAEEVLQDSFEYAFRKLSSYDANKSAFKTWLYRIAISRCRNKRRRKWLPTFSLSQIINQEITDTKTLTPDETAVLNDRQKIIWQALSQLSPKLQETAVLRYYEGFSYVEIGAILDIPAKTAESRMRLAHKALRKLLDKKEVY